MELSYDDRSEKFWHSYDLFEKILDDIPIDDLVYQLVKLKPELANDLYFKLDEILVKKVPEKAWHEELTKVMHEWVNPTQKTYRNITIEDAADGSGDGILTFTPEFLEETGWKEGDTIFMKVSDDRKLILRKKD